MGLGIVLMKVHELVEHYRKAEDEMRESFELALWRQRRRMAYLQHLDPSTPVKPGLWDGFLVWDNEKRGRLDTTLKELNDAADAIFLYDGERLDNNNTETPTL